MKPFVRKVIAISDEALAIFFKDPYSMLVITYIMSGRTDKEWRGRGDKICRKLVLPGWVIRKTLLRLEERNIITSLKFGKKISCQLSDWLLSHVQIGLEFSKPGILVWIVRTFIRMRYRFRKYTRAFQNT